MDIWFISDTHFKHKNILSFQDKNGSLFRGDLFTSVEAMDEYMIQQWNSVVKPTDRVYHLGDVGVGKKELHSTISRLNGSKRLILGNHDNAIWLAKSGLFKKISMWRMFPEYNFILSHVPLHPSSLNNLVNVHGHTHEKGSPGSQYRSVCVEMTDYTPVHLDTLIQEAKNVI